MIIDAIGHFCCFKVFIHLVKIIVLRVKNVQKVLCEQLVKSNGRFVHTENTFVVYFAQNGDHMVFFWEHSYKPILQNRKKSLVTCKGEL